MSENKKSVEQIEQERLTRRQALRKFGFGAGMSAIMLLGADDLARMVGDRMRQTEIDREATDQVAKELRGVGIAFADGDDPLPGNGGSDSLVCSSQGCVDPDQCNTHHYSWLKCPKCGSFGNCVYEQFNCSGTGAARLSCCDDAQTSCLAVGGNNCHNLWTSCSNGA